MLLCASNFSYYLWLDLKERLGASGLDHRWFFTYQRVFFSQKNLIDEVDPMP